MMKPYFKTGNDYRDFQRVWLGWKDDDERIYVKERGPGFFYKYLLVRPGSKYYYFSWIIYVITIMASFIIIPYEALVARNQAILSSPTKELLITLDILWAVHIC